MRVAGLIAFIAVASAAIVAIASVKPPGNAPNSGWQLRDGAVIDGGTLFIMNPASGIDAIDAATGQRLWHSDAAEKPLAVEQGRLLAQRNPAEKGELALSLLEASSGSMVAESSLEIASDVSARVTAGLGSQFSIEVLDPGKELRLAWRATQRVARGIPSHDGGDGPSRQLGAAQVNMRDGAIKSIDPASLPLRAAKAAIEAEHVAGAAGRQFLSIDGNHVLASEKTHADEWLRYTWTIYDRAGQRVGATRTFVAFAPFIVRDDTLIFSTPPYQRSDGAKVVVEDLTVRGISLADNAQWHQDLRDTRYRGPHPP